MSLTLSMVKNSHVLSFSCVIFFEMKVVSTLFLLTFALFLCVNHSTCAIFSWLFDGFRKESSSKQENFHGTYTVQKEKPVSKLNGEDTNYNARNIKIPFEISLVDEKFITEMAKYSSAHLGDLDICYHKVFLTVETSCSKMSEETISKVAVILLNCQSSIEGRRTFRCSEEMLIHECTEDMDQSTWNAYHIMSNRVRAVCYDLRHQQFRAKAEMTVDRLILSTEQQIGAMKILEESHDIVKRATVDTLNTLSVGQLELQKQQLELTSAHLSVHNYVSSNLRELSKEKSLIASGQRELARTSSTIKKKLDATLQQLELLEDEQRSSRKQILSDLIDIQESASKVWNQLDASTQKILKAHEHAVSHYIKLLEDLREMNGTVHHVMALLIRMRIKVEEKFAWISSFLEDTESTIQKIYSLVAHICYCLVCMISSIFLQVPYATRIALIILVPLNAFTELNNGISLPFPTVSAILAVVLFFNLSSVHVYSWCKNMSHLKSKTRQFLQGGDDRKPQNESFEEFSSEEDSFLPRKQQLEKDEVRASSRQNGLSFPKFASNERKLSMMTILGGNRLRNLSSAQDLIPQPVATDGESLEGDVRRRHHKDITSPFDPSMNTRASTPSEQRYDSSQSGKTSCIAICKSGLHCKNSSIQDSLLCHRHSRECTPVF